MSLKDQWVIWLTCLFKKTWKIKKIYDGCKKSLLGPIYRNKREIQNYYTYRGISYYEILENIL